MYSFVMSLSAIRYQFGISNLSWNLSESHPLGASSSIFGCARRIFLFFVTVEPPCCFAMCEWTSDYSHRFVTVTTRQPQLQPLLNRRVNDAIPCEIWNVIQVFWAAGQTKTIERHIWKKVCVTRDDGEVGKTILQRKMFTICSQFAVQ